MFRRPRMYLLVLLGVVLVAISAGHAGSNAVGVGEASTPLQAKVGTFVKRTGVGVQQVAGVGFRPKALILFGTTQQSEGFEGEYQLSIGVSDGTNDGSIGGWSWDEDPPGLGSDADCAQVDAGGDPAALLYVETIGGIAAAATVASFNADGFTLNWHVDKYERSWIVHYLALGGDEITDARVAMFDAANSTPGEKSYDIGFRSDMLLFLGVRYTTRYPHPHYALNLALGAATDSYHQTTVAVASEDSGRNPTDTWRYQSTSKAIAFLMPSSGDVESEAELVSMDANGFTLDWTNPASEDRSFYYLALKGGRYAIGNETQRTGSTGLRSTTGLGFEPAALLLTSFNRTASVDRVAHNRLSLGAATGEGEASIWVGDTDNILNGPRTDKATYAGKALVLSDSDSPTAASAEASLQSFDPGGFTLNWSKVDAVEREFLYIAAGRGPAVPTPAPVGGLADTMNEAEEVRPDGGVGAGIIVAGIAISIALVLMLTMRRWRPSILKKGGPTAH